MSELLDGIARCLREDDLDGAKTLITQALSVIKEGTQEMEALSYLSGLFALKTGQYEKWLAELPFDAAVSEEFINVLEGFAEELGISVPERTQ